MRKFFTLLVCCALLISLAPAYAETSVDLSTLSDAELLELWQAAGDRLREVGAYPYIELSKGDEGVDVTNLQTRLKALYYFADDLTGKYADSTVKAVKAFEKANGIKPDGKMSIDEQDLLYSNSAVPKATSTPSPAPAPSPTPIPDSVMLTVTAVSLQDYYNTKVFSIKLKNYSDTETVDAFTVAHRCYDTYGELLSASLANPGGIEYAEWWKDLSLKPGKSFSMGSYFWYLFDYQTCAKIEVAISKYHTKSGSTVVIPESEYVWVSGDLK